MFNRSVYFLVFFLLMSFSLMSGAQEVRRQELPREKTQEQLESTPIEETEEKPVPGEPAPAEEKMSLKNFYKDHFSVSLSAGEEWDSNIFLDEENEESDFISVLGPDVLFHTSREHGYFEASWTGRYAYYWDSDEITKTNSFSGMGFVTPHDKLAIGLKGYADITEDSEVPTVFGDRILLMGYKIWSVGPEVKYQLSDRWALGLNYQFDSVDIDQDELDDDVDRNTNGAGVNAEYELAADWFLLGGYGFRDVNFSEADNKDAFSNLYTGGIRKKFPALFNVDLKLTFHDKNFDESEDDSNVDVIGSIQTTFSRYTTLIFSGSYALQESSRSEYSQYTSTRLSLLIQHYLTKKTTITMRASYELQGFDAEDSLVDFTEGDQDSSTYNVSLTLRQMLLDWLSLEVGYSYQERSTDFEGEGLVDHIARAGVRAYF